MAVAKRHIVDDTRLDPLLQPTKRDMSRIARLGPHRVHRAVATDHAQPIRRLEALTSLADEIDKWALVGPRRSDQLNTRRRLHRLTIAQHRHVAWRMLTESLRPEDRGRVQRIMVARQQIEGKRGRSAHLVQGPHEHLPADVVRLEHVAAHHHEVTVLLHGKLRDGADHLDAGFPEPGPGLLAQVVRRPTKLPVRRVHEPHHAWMINSTTSVTTGVPILCRRNTAAVDLAALRSGLQGRPETWVRRICD